MKAYLETLKNPPRILPSSVSGTPITGTQKSSSSAFSTTFSENSRFMYVSQYCPIWNLAR